MSAHSDEIWESFDALARHVQRLANRVSEMEAKLRTLEEAGPEGEFQGGSKAAEGFSVTSKSA
ncbi:MAG TPA: hypothetical protein VNH22_19075 [Blastocatellia bacterium]|nr:hypothetical protein [Blastocatellia bacterium]